MAKFKSITVGERFGRMTALSSATTSNQKCKCLCDCGVTKDVKAYSLRMGTTTSCGCRKLEGSAVKHGHNSAKRGKSLTYSSWANMITRCTCRSHRSFPNYGGRGITVCERWRRFENFLEDMGECQPGHSIDRKDNSLGYEPNNCKWSTSKQQARNTRTNKLLTFNGETLCVAAWAEKRDLSEDVIGSRIIRGWTVENALGTPVQKRCV